MLLRQPDARFSGYEGKQREQAHVAAAPDSFPPAPTALLSTFDRAASAQSDHQGAATSDHAAAAPIYAL